MKRRLAALLALASLAAAAIPSAAAAAPLATLPDCTFDDVLTPQREYLDWTRTMLDTTLRVGSRYTPPNLVPVSEARIAGVGKVRPLVVPDLRALARAARNAGVPLEVASAYRSYERQARVFEYWRDAYGRRIALATSARPGHSEHQLGTALDFMALNGRAPWNLDDWALTRTGAWLKANAWKYGFVMSYPLREKATTCYRYEPWHYRYFGRWWAAHLHANELTTREWLWRRGFGVV